MTGLQLADGSPVNEPLEIIKNKVAETLEEFQSEFV